MTTDDYKLDVDARNLDCPLPILKTKKALAQIGSGELLRVTTTDPGARRDFESFCRQTGNELVRVDEADGTTTFVLRRR